MLFKSALNVSGYTGIEMALLILDDVDEPNSLLHAIMIANMDTITIPFSELRFSFSRSGGAGGQNVNKVNSKVVMNWDPSVSVCPPAVIKRFQQKFSQYVLADGTVQIMSQESRSQKENIDLCVRKLHDMLKAVARPPKLRRPTRPKRSAVLKRLDGKRKDSDKKRSRSKNYE